MGKNQPKNAVIVGFHSESSVKAINMLKQNGIINIKAWIGIAPDCTHDIMSFYVGDFKGNEYNGIAQDIYDEIFHTTIYQFMDMMSRHSFYAEKSFYDLLNIYNIYFDYFSKLLIENDIDVLLTGFPHEGADLIIYKIAKKLNIKTILFYQSLFPNKFFYVYNMEDFGDFNEIKPTNKNLDLKIENKYEKELFYHSNVKKYNDCFFCLQRKSLLGSLVINIFKKTNILPIKNFIKRYFSFKNKSPVTGRSKTDSHDFVFPLIKELIIRMMSFSKRFLQRFLNHIEARKNLMHIINHQVDLNKKYIYFPLHFQPELTTSGLGGIYADQILAIERLSKLIPDDWFIYVKENPAQTELMRGKWFFARLWNIKKVKVISPEFDTYDLTKNCIFVATITGTAGWEAISGGKNTLIFGNAWYKKLPGVFFYTANFKLEDILNYKINHFELERELNLLLCKTADGVIEPNYAVLVNDFDAKKNALSIATFIEQIII